MRSISAAGLVLEPLTAADAGEMFGLLCDPDLYRYLDWGPPPSLDHLRRVYTALESRASPDGSEQWLNWVVRGGNREPLGYVQATLVAPDTAWVAYVFGTKHWGQGWALAATSAMIEHLRDAYGCARFLATVETKNLRSISLLRKLSFRRASAQEAKAHELTASELLFVWQPVSRHSAA